MYVQPMCMESMRGKSMTRHSSVPPASGVVQYSTRRRHSRSLDMPRIDYWPDRVLVEVFLFTLVNSSKGRLCCRLTEVAVSNIEQQGDGDADIDAAETFCVSDNRRRRRPPTLDNTDAANAVLPQASQHCSVQPRWSVIDCAAKYGTSRLTGRLGCE